MRDQRGADWAMLAIISILFVVLMVGFLSSMPARRTIELGAAVQDPCASCAGPPVCAATDGVVSNYESACAAACAGARVVFADLCERIPQQ